MTFRGNFSQSEEAVRCTSRSTKSKDRTEMLLPQITNRGCITKDYGIKRSLCSALNRAARSWEPQASSPGNGPTNCSEYRHNQQTGTIHDPLPRTSVLLRSFKRCAVAAREFARSGSTRVAAWAW